MEQKIENCDKLTIKKKRKENLRKSIENKEFNHTHTDANWETWEGRKK